MSILLVGGVAVGVLGAALLVVLAARSGRSVSDQFGEPSPRDRANRDVDDARIEVARLRGRQWPQ